ncbi:hypothetical protein N0B51_10835 [Tsuneonella sp. YG55]|uniref:Lipoprotein n=1 Tax=Tsuneonella litorea TaxID=2976475 RepID=A0A9X3ALP4_9SPHN|nr:hypothetical protein [Tsuneonella litorea]MCT2559473.1 hypothetical protein [Tsuneonella litorea]
MTKTRRLIALPLVLAIAACGGNDAGAEGERKTAAGEVLGGSISDDMLPLDTLTSQSPPLREKADAETRKSPSAEAADAPAEASDPSAAPAEAAEPPPGE